MQNSYDNPITNGDTAEPRHVRPTNTKVISKTTIANPDRIRTSPSIRMEHSKDKELINSGLHKLVSSFNTANHNKLAAKQSRTQHKKKVPVEIVEEDGDDSKKLDLPANNVASHIVLTKQMSVDKYTMTEAEKLNECRLENASTVLSEEANDNLPSTRDLQWTDPRLLKKYSLVKQPYKKSFSIPLVNKSQFQYAEHLNEVISEEEEDLDEDIVDEAEIFADNTKNYMLRILYYFCTISVSLVGFFCGIVLVTLILWKLLDESVLRFAMNGGPPADLYMRKYLGTVLSSILYLVDSLVTKLMRALTISAKEVFVQEEQKYPWYRKYI